MYHITDGAHPETLFWNANLPIDQWIKGSQDHIRRRRTVFSSQDNEELVRRAEECLTRKTNKKS